MHVCISIIMRASYDSIDNKHKMCEKVNKDITFIQFFHSTRLHSTELFKIFFSLLTLQLLFCKKLVGREKIIHGTLNTTHYKLYIVHYTEGVANLWPVGQMWPFLNFLEEQEKRSPKIFGRNS